MNNIRKLRQLRGVSQQELADKTGIARNTLSGYETGAIHAPSQRLITIANVLKCSVSDLITVDGIEVDIGELIKKLQDEDITVTYQNRVLSKDERAYIESSITTAANLINVVYVNATNHKKL